MLLMQIADHARCWQYWCVWLRRWFLWINGEVVQLMILITATLAEQAWLLLNSTWTCRIVRVSYHVCSRGKAATYLLTHFGFRLKSRLVRWDNFASFPWSVAADDVNVFVNASEIKLFPIQKKKRKKETALVIIDNVCSYRKICWHDQIKGITKMELFYWGFST